MAKRLLLLIAALSFSAEAAFRVGEPLPIGGEVRAPAQVAALEQRVVATSWGFLSVWQEFGSLYAARLTKDGKLLDDPALLVVARESDPVALTSSPETDGTDVLLTYHSRVAGGAVSGIVRITAAGEVIPVRRLADLASAIVWTGKGYLVLLGGCIPTEALQLDRDGAVIRSVRLRFPDRRCEPMRPLIYRDRDGIFRLIVQTEPPYHRSRIALTDAHGDPVAAPVVEPLDSSSGALVRGAGATSDGFYLLFEDAIQFASESGEPGRRVSFNAYGLAATSSNGDVLVAGFTHRDKGTRLVVWSVGPHRSATELAPGPVSQREKGSLIVLPAPYGAACFWTETEHSGRRMLAMSTVSHQPRGRRLRRPIAVARNVPWQNYVSAAAHGDGMLAVWLHAGMLDDEIHAVLLDSSARPAAAPRLLMHGDYPRMASNGEMALVTANTAAGLIALRLDRDGRPLDRKPVLFPRLFSYDVLWDGSVFVIVSNASAVRIDESGTVLGHHQFPLVDGHLPQLRSLGVSPVGALYVFEKSRIPGLDPAPAIYAQALSRDLRPLGEPTLISVVDAHHFAPKIFWHRDHYLVGWTNGSDIRGTRVSADGKPLDGDLAELLATNGYYSWVFGAVDGRAAVATAGALFDLTARERKTDVPFGTNADPAAIVNTRDGRTWVFYEALDPFAPGWLPRAFAREIE